jgi:CO dehydrogenase maturation factor
VTWLGHEPAIRAMEQGRAFALSDLSAGTLAALGALRDAVDGQRRDWARYSRQAAEFHVRNAGAWAGAAAGVDLAAQVDPDFTLGPAALAGAGRRARARRRPPGCGLVDVAAAAQQLGGVDGAVAERAGDPGRLAATPPPA